MLTVSRPFGLVHPTGIVFEVLALSREYTDSVYSNHFKATAVVRVCLSEKTVNDNPANQELQAIKLLDHERFVDTLGAEISDDYSLDLTDIRFATISKYEYIFTATLSGVDRERESSVHPAVEAFAEITRGRIG